CPDLVEVTMASQMVRLSFVLVLPACAFLLLPTSGRAGDGPTSPRKAPNDLWDQLTTIGVLRGKWLKTEAYTGFCTSTDPNDLLAAFPEAEALLIAAIALETGQVRPFFEARYRPGRPVPLPDKAVELRYEVRRRQGREGLQYQPVYVLRIT